MTVRPSLDCYPNCVQHLYIFIIEVCTNIISVLQRRMNPITRSKRLKCHGTRVVTRARRTWQTEVRSPRWNPNRSHKKIRTQKQSSMPFRNNWRRWRWRIVLRIKQSEATWMFFWFCFFKTLLTSLWWIESVITTCWIIFHEENYFICTAYTEANKSS